jgi:hypothetical protein
MEENQNKALGPKQKSDLQITFTLPSDCRLGETARKALQLKFDHPEYTMKQMGEMLGVSATRIGQIMRHPRFIQMLPWVARQRIQDMAPSAAKAYQALIAQNVNLQVKEKAASKVLSETKVFDAPTIRVEGEITLRSVRELEQIVRKAADQPQDVIEAEIIPPENPSV